MPAQPNESKLNSRYQFHAVIGHGGTGEVSTAWDTQLERTVAIKRLRVSHMNDENMGTTWQEAMRLAAIRHANIVAVYDIGIEDGSPYVVMEYVQGETIEQRIERSGPLHGEEFAEFARQAMEGITAAHHAGLIHRDVKPANIMLSRQPSGSALVKVLDFGIARFTNSHTQASEEQETITGSIHCIAPEQLNREPVDARTDLYSLGCVFYYSLAGRYPFNGPKVQDVIQAHLRHDVVPLGDARPDVAPELCQWVMALINRQPDLRHASAQLALQHLNGIISVTSRTMPIPLPFPSGAVPVQPLAQPTAPSRSWMVPALAGIAATLLLVIAFLLWPKPAQPVIAVNPPPAPPALAETKPQTPPSETPVIAAKPEVKPEAAKVVVEPPQPTPAPVPEAQPEVVLRLHGSNTIGAKLAPMLAEEFFKREGATSVERVPGKTIEELTVIARFNSRTPRAIEIAAHGTKTAFDGLASGAESNAARKPAAGRAFTSAARRLSRTKS